MSKKLSTKDVQKLLESNEEGFSSSDESEDFCEEQIYRYDNTLNILEQQTNNLDNNSEDDVLNETTSSSGSNEEESEENDFSSNLSLNSNNDYNGISSSQSAMSIASFLNNQENHSTINMSVESLAVTSSTSIHYTIQNRSFTDAKRRVIYDYDGIISIYIYIYIYIYLFIYFVVFIYVYFYVF